MTQATRIHQPANFQLQHQGFFMVAFSDAAKIIQEKLSGSVLRLWVYLMLHCPFADYTKDGKPIYKRIESPKEIALILGVSRRTVERDMRKLQELELYEYEIAQWNGHNLSALHAKQESERLKRAKQAQSQPEPKPAQNDPDKIIPIATNLSQPRQISRDCDKIDATPIYNDRALDQTIQIYTDGKDETAAAAPDPIPDPELTPGSDTSPEDPALQKDQVHNQNIDIVSVENINSGDGQCFAACNTVVPRAVAHDINTNAEVKEGGDEVMRWGGGEVEKVAPTTPSPHYPTTPSPSVRWEDLTESDKEIYKKANTLGTTRCYNAPWREGANIKPECTKTLFDSNIEYYSLEGQKGKINTYKIASAIKKAEGRLTSSDYLDAIAAYQWLMNLTAIVEKVDPTKPKYFSASEQEETEIVDMQDPAIKARFAAARKELEAKNAARKIKA